MIKGSWRDAGADLHSALRRAVRCVAAAAASGESIPVPSGWRVVRGDYTTGNWDGRLESHRRYIDLHAVMEGKERIAVAAVEGLPLLGPYSAEEDTQFYAAEHADFIELAEGEFLVLDTKEAHMPKVAAESPGGVRKLVLKIPASDLELAADAAL